jgi:hypothetical protein
MITLGPVARGAGALVVGTLVVDGPRRDADSDEPEAHPPEAIARSVAATTTAPVDGTRRCPARSMVAIAAPRAAGAGAPIVAGMQLPCDAAPTFAGRAAERMT